MHEGHFLKEKVLNMLFDASATFKTSYLFKKGLQILKRKKWFPDLPSPLAAYTAV